jgi:hypothetical protein
MSDKIYVIFSPLGDISTADFGVVDYKDGKFSLNKAKWYNRLRQAANAGANLIRVLPFSCWSVPDRETMFQPFAWNMVQGAWDVDNYNSYYFVIFKEAIAVAKSLGLKVQFELFDNCGLWPTVRWLNPWCWNIQGMSDFYSATNPVYKWVNKVMEELGDICEISEGNELTEAVGVTAYGTSMFSYILPIFQMHEKVPFMYGAMIGKDGNGTISDSLQKKMTWDVEATWNENTKIAVFRQNHSCGSEVSEYVVVPCYWWGKSFHACQFSDDGINPRPSISQWVSMAKAILNNYDVEATGYGMAGKIRIAIEHCPKSIDSAEEAKTVAAIVGEAEQHGLSFENKGKFPNDYVEPAPPIPPEPPVPSTPVPKIKCSYWYWLNINDSWLGVPNFLRGLFNGTKYCKVIKR